MKIKEEYKNILLFSIPIFIIFLIVLLAYYPGILVSDSMYQWHQTQVGKFNDWHPAYNTIYIFLLTRIWNSPFFVLLIQCIVLSFSIGYFISKLYKYYNINKWYLFVCSITLAIIPLNFNSAVVLLKDTLYSAFIIILSAVIVNLINDDKYLNKKRNLFKIGLLLLLIMLTRHNGIYAVFLFSIALIFVYRKKYALYLTLLLSIVCYILMTTVGFNILNIQGGNVANKYAPVSHVLARVMKENKQSIKKDELKTISKYVDIDGLVKNFNPCNMDLAIAEQDSKMLRKSGSEYLKTAVKIFARNPIIVIKHYLYLDSFLYSPIQFKNYFSVGLFTETDLWEYKNVYPELNENSKIKWLLPTIKKVSNKFNVGIMSSLFMKPAIYMYLIIISSYLFSKKYNNKKILLIGLFMICNTISLAVAMPIAMTRYVYSTILLGYLMGIWVLYYIYTEYIKDWYERHYSKNKTKKRKTTKNRKARIKSAN